MSDSLLPSNASKLDRSIEKVIEHCTQFPVDVRDLWDPWRCPFELLPWLAWAYSVDSWSEHWPEQTKRRVVDSSFQVHQHKATPFAVQRALDALGIKTNIVEWWEQAGTGEPGTMKVLALLNENLTGDADGLINANMLKLVTESINVSKRGSIHFDVDLGISLEESIGFAAAPSPGYGLLDPELDEQPVTPDALSAATAFFAVEHRVICADDDLNFGNQMELSAETEILLAAGVHHLQLIDHDLTGVA